MPIINKSALKKAIEDLRASLKLNCYCHLKGQLMIVKKMGHLKASLNVPQAQLEQLAKDLIMELRVMIRRADEASADYELAHTDSPSAIHWRECKTAYQNAIVLTRALEYHKGRDYYLCYGSDAVKVMFYTDRLPEQDAEPNPKIAIPAHRLNYYQKQLASYGMRFQIHE